MYRLRIQVPSRSEVHVWESPDLCWKIPPLCVVQHDEQGHYTLRNLSPVSHIFKGSRELTK